MLDTPPEARFDRITRHAAWAFSVPFCLVTFVDEHRQWFKSCHGLEMEQTERVNSFCAHTILSDALLVSGDTLQDARFKDNPFVVGAPGIRFYAGAPLKTPEGERLGTLCILDTSPREFSPEQQAVLRDLADVVEEELERSRLALERKRETERTWRLESRFRHVVQHISDLVTMLDAEGTIHYQSPSVERVLGYAPHELAGQNAFEHIHPDDFSLVHSAFEQLVQESGENRVIPFRFRSKAGRWVWLEANATNQLGDPALEAVIVTSRDVTERKRMEAHQAEKQRILAQIARRAPLAEVLDAICRFVEEEVEGEGLCSILLREREQLRHGAGPSLPPAYCAALQDIEIGPEVGSCGTAAYLKETVVVEDISRDPKWGQYRDVALAHGLQACFSTPILARDEEVLGTFAVYYPQPQSPPQEHLQLVETATSLAGIALENARDERALRESEESFRALAQLASQIVWRIGPDGGVALTDASWTQYTGQQREAWSRLGWAEMIHPEDRARVLALWDAQQVSGDVTESELRIRGRDGRYRWFFARTVPVRDEEGGLREFIGTATDIDARKVAEARLRESEGRYRVLSALVSTFAFSYVVDDEGEARLEWMTDSIEKVMGYTPETLVGEVWGSRVADDHAAHAAAHLKEVLAGNQTTNELLLRGQDGQARWYRVVVQPEWDEAHERVVRLYGAGQDVTEQKEYEHALVEAKERAEEMSRLKDTFLANMSHEIRTPLTSIIGFSNVLADETEGEAQELAQLIYQSGERLKDTLNAVLDLALLESGSLQMQPSKLELVMLARQTTELFRGDAEARGITLAFTACQRHIWAELDRGAVARILGNLLSNAVKFTQKGGVSVTVGRGQDHAWLRVADTGIGIEASFVPQLFDDFMQESSGLSRNYEGSGLGLAITRRLVEMMAGRISVETEKGRGSTFTVRLPVEQPKRVV